MNEECFSQSFASRRNVHGEATNQGDRHRMTRKVFEKGVTTNRAAGERVVAEYARVIVAGCDIRPRYSFTFVLTGIPLQVGIQFFDTAIEITAVVMSG